MPAVPMSWLNAWPRRAACAAPLLLLVTACAPGLTPAVAGTRPAPVAAPTAPAPAVAEHAALPEAEYLHARQLMVPVAGVSPSRLTDSYNAPRDGGARVHRAIDIMAPRGTPVLAADDGRVYRISENRLGGLTIYAIDAAGRFMYYYAHLDGYREGLRVGMPLARGDVIGYVGSTGNASASAPHLHFQAMRYRPDRYWDGEPVNPRPFLALAGRPVVEAVSANVQHDQQQTP